MRRICWSKPDRFLKGSPPLLRFRGRGLERQRQFIWITDERARYIGERRLRFRDTAGPAFITSTQTRQGISETSLRRIIRKVRAASGIAFSMHSLRHSFITTLLNNGTPIHVAQHLAGHSKIMTTAGYLALTDGDLRREIQKMSFRTARAA